MSQNPLLRAQTPTEQRVETIWRHVLTLDELDREMRFLDLGGDSLLAVLCISRMRREFDLEFALEDFFTDSSTVTGFAQLIDQVASAK